ncbi:AlpA family phage regulatory protein [Aliiroseovarius zhejiangensis]|uniref:AlpA family phage regulatory protein n=1 Tax=Aliiroseovarius zhejiangensis TaxID=1632025 RepID=A0ABQ3IVX3_9RHOB|nr:AlpA family transcriptional regulator [Aliiroseovarius zhejiangensis]GHE95122.1 AlpA family phage regulatory protein [Aliiroseovarius zhejiangensis]
MTQNKIYRRPDVEQLVGLSRSTLYAMMAEGTFPKPIKLGKRAVGWRAIDIEAWFEARSLGGVFQ